MRKMFLLPSRGERVGYEFKQTMGRGRRALLCAVSLTCLAGCEYFWNQPPAPVVRYGAEAGVGSAGAHTVVAEDTLWNIANRYHISMQDLVLANGLQPPYAMKAGQRLKIPPPQTYKVRRGDSLYTVSRLFNISTTSLARMNNLSAPYQVAQGQVLRLPAQTPPAQVPPPAQTPPAPVSPRVETYAQAQAYGQTYVPSAGIETESLPPPPGMNTRFGELGGSAVDGMPPQPVPRAPYEGNNPDSWQGVPQTDMQVAALPPVAAPAATPSWSPPPVSDAPRTNGKFEWPVMGKVVSTYGPKTGGEHNDGINIAAPRGTPVRAAEDGTVVYADNELKGFGNLILIRHVDRWMTAYAHLDGMSVKNGTKVKRGETIGTVGATGSVDTPQLHFEVRRGTEAINPSLYLAKTGR